MSVLSSGPRRAPRWFGAVAVTAALVLAAGCVTELTDELGEFTYVVGVNRGGDRVITDYGWLTRLDADGTRIRLAAPAGFETAYIVGHQPIDDGGFAFGMASSTANRDTIPVMWDPDGKVTDLRRYLPRSNCADLYSTTPTVNRQGVVVGSITCGSPLEPEAHDLYVFDRRDESVRYLPAPAQDEGDFGGVQDINDQGVIVGYGHTGGARWTRQGDGYRYEHLDLRPTDINNHGDILGSRYVDGRSQPFFLRAGESTSVALTSPGGTGLSSIEDGRINDQRQIVLTVYTTGIDTQGVRYPSPESTTPETFPGIGGNESYFEALGEDGAAYGQARDEQNLFRAVRWTPDPKAE